MDGQHMFIEKAMQRELRGQGGRTVAALFIKADRKLSGYVDIDAAVHIICDVLRKSPKSVVPLEFLDTVGFKDYIDKGKVKYGPFLAKLRHTLQNRKEPDKAGTGLQMRDDDERLSKTVAKLPITELKELIKILNERLPQYHQKATRAYLDSKDAANSEMTRKDFKRFLLHMNIDVTDKLSADLFDTIDDNGSGHMHASEFIAAFGDAICGASETSGETGTGFAIGSENPTGSHPNMDMPELTVPEVKAMVEERLGQYFSSSTKAFLKAKGTKKSSSMSLDDMRNFLVNMNIQVGDATIKKLMSEFDENGDGDVDAKEFLSNFGAAISGSGENQMATGFTNTRNEKVTVVPEKPLWTKEGVRAVLGQRLGLYNKSATAAFMKAKSCRSLTMNFSDMRQMLLNLNIEADDDVVQGIMDEIDTDKNGTIDCVEFMQAFGGDIAGYAGSVDVKQPVWLLQEVKRINDVLQDLTKMHGEEVLDDNPAHHGVPDMASTARSKHVQMPGSGKRVGGNRSGNRGGGDGNQQQRPRTGGGPQKPRLGYVPRRVSPEVAQAQAIGAANRRSRSVARAALLGGMQTRPMSSVQREEAGAGTRNMERHRASSAGPSRRGESRGGGNNGRVEDGGGTATGMRPSSASAAMRRRHLAQLPPQQRRELREEQMQAPLDDRVEADKDETWLGPEDGVTYTAAREAGAARALVKSGVYDFAQDGEDPDVIANEVDDIVGQIKSLEKSLGAKTEQMQDLFDNAAARPSTTTGAVHRGAGARRPSSAGSNVSRGSGPPSVRAGSALGQGRHRNSTMGRKLTKAQDMAAALNGTLPTSAPHGSLTNDFAQAKPQRLVHRTARLKSRGSSRASSAPQGKKRPGQSSDVWEYQGRLHNNPWSKA